MRDSGGISVPLIPAMSEEWHAFAHALIEQRRVETELGVMGSICWYGSMRDMPSNLAYELALAEDRVLTTEAALRLSHGITPEMDRATLAAYHAKQRR